MLKIKDNAISKILEKYGFKKDGFNTYAFSPKEGQGVIIVRMFVCDSYVELNSNGKKCDEILDILFDLIKADLVEKVVE